jgi:hypothetical protein
VVIDQLWLCKVNWDFSLLLQQFLFDSLKIFQFNKVLFGDGGFFLELVPASAMLLV